MRAGLRVPHTGQCVSGAQARHQSAEEGQSARDAGGQNESADTQDHLSRAEDHVRHAQGLCDIVTNHEAQLSVDFFKTAAAAATAAQAKAGGAKHTIYIRNAIESERDCIEWPCHANLSFYPTYIYIYIYSIS